MKFLERQLMHFYLTMYTDTNLLMISTVQELPPVCIHVAYSLFTHFPDLWDGPLDDVDAIREIVFSSKPYNGDYLDFNKFDVNNSVDVETISYRINRDYMTLYVKIKDILMNDSVYLITVTDMIDFFSHILNIRESTETSFLKTCEMLKFYWDHSEDSNNLNFVKLLDDTGNITYDNTINIDKLQYITNLVKDTFELNEFKGMVITNFNVTKNKYYVNDYLIISDDICILTNYENTSKKISYIVDGVLWNSLINFTS